MEIDPFILLEAAVPIVENPVCNAESYKNITIDNTMICAGFDRTGTCGVSIYCICDCFSGNNFPLLQIQGDSGGPLVTFDQQKQVWRLQGLTSFGNPGCIPPNVYTRVAAFNDFILQTIVAND